MYRVNHGTSESIGRGSFRRPSALVQGTQMDQTLRTVLQSLLSCSVFIHKLGYSPLLEGGCENK